MTCADSKQFPPAYASTDDQAHHYAWRLSELVNIATRILALLERPTVVPRLNAETCRDIGLSPDEYQNAPLWGHGKIMWWP